MDKFVQFFLRVLGGRGGREAAVGCPGFAAGTSMSSEYGSCSCETMFGSEEKAGVLKKFIYESFY